jgi:adenylate cyclase class 2
MKAPATNQEIEIKLRLRDAGDARKALRRAGFRIRRRRIFESNVIYDTPEHVLRSQGKLLRVRETGHEALLTYKGPPAPGKHKSREELECPLAQTGTFSEILGRLGYVRIFRYEKYRTEFEQENSNGTLTIDETPIGDFMELEGPPDWIDATASALGFTEADYITDSYGRLYMDFRTAHRDLPSDMVFRGRRPAGKLLVTRQE